MVDHFDRCLTKVNMYLKLVGLGLDKSDNEKTVLQRMWSHRIYMLYFISIYNLEIIAELYWPLDAISTGKRFLEITYLFPCLTFCILGDFKSMSLLCHVHHANNIVDFLKTLQSKPNSKEERDIFANKLTGEHSSVLISAANKIIWILISGLLMFIITPIFIMVPHYYNTGEIELVLPFIAYYPFDEFDLRYYPWVYLHQVCTGAGAVFMVFATDFFFFTCCTFIHVQFLMLQYDMERVIPDESHNYDKATFIKLAKRHINLMKCVDSLEAIFSKSILINALTSSTIICVTGFNVMMIDNVFVMASFTAFLIFGLLQIFLFCYYGDSIMRSSMDISNAIYNSTWYNIPPSERKALLIVLTRAQKPCKFTANGFFDIDLNCFTRILSKSLSYFALLQTIYHPE